MIEQAMETFTLAKTMVKICNTIAMLHEKVNDISLSDPFMLWEKCEGPICDGFRDKEVLASWNFHISTLFDYNLIKILITRILCS